VFTLYGGGSPRRFWKTGEHAVIFTIGKREQSEKTRGTREHEIYWETGEQSPFRRKAMASFLPAPDFSDTSDDECVCLVFSTLRNEF
jgi:hypothetical protein